MIAGSFDTDDDGLRGVDPAQWYVASYLAVVIAAIGLVMVPVHLAAYGERGVLRRFGAAGFPPCSFALAQLVLGVEMTLVASAVLLAVAAPVYGLPPITTPLTVLEAVLAGALATDEPETVDTTQHARAIFLTLSRARVAMRR